MTSISGIQTNGAVKIATTWGTAVTVGAGNKIPAKYTPNVDVNELLSDQVGTGLEMDQSAYRGLIIPKVSIAGQACYRGFDYILAQMMGTAAAPTEATSGKGDWVHTVQFNTTLNAKYATVAFEGYGAGIYEYPTVAFDTISFKIAGVPAIADFTASGMANDLYITGGTVSPTNNNAGIQGATIGDTERVVCHQADTFWLNAQSGSTLGSGNALNIIDLEVQLSRPQKLVGEIKGAAGFNPPIFDGRFNGTLKVTCRELIDFSQLINWQNESALKARFTVQGTQISSGSTNKTYDWYFPSMELIKFPSYSVSAPGQNPVVYEFRLLKASANPTGMTDVYPYCKITNTLATSLLA